LDSTVDGLPLRAVYYAHHLRDPGSQGDGDPIDDLEPEAEAMLRAWLEMHDVEPGVAQGPGTAAIRQALGWIAERRGILEPAIRSTFELFVGTFFREVARYLSARDVQARFRARAAVAEVVAAAEPPRIVLAHSLGSVVAYEALCAYPHLDVDLLVTLGSPLAMPHAVFPNLDPRPIDGKGRRPPGVRRWANLADVGDLVALPAHGMPRHFHGIDPADDREVTIHPLDFHLVANYLSSSALADVVRKYL